MELRPYQKEAKDAIIESWKEHQKSLLVLPTGCHDADQGILMYDGSIKKACEIQVRDQLMGDDGTPRTVLRLNSGKDYMYEIIPVKGKSFIVNGGHILSLVRTNEASNPTYPCEAQGGKIVNISVKDYISSTKWFKHLHKLYRAEQITAFSGNENEELPVDPYFLGILLGDGCLKYGISITTPDEEIVSCIHEQVAMYGYSLRSEPAGTAKTYHIQSHEKGVKGSTLTNQLKQLQVYGKGSYDKFVPYNYKTASVNVRSEILAGLLDTDGSLTCKGYDFISASKQLSEDVAYIARSLGLAAYVKECTKSCEGFTGSYWRVSISGECSIIPIRVDRKKSDIRLQKKNVLRTGIKEIRLDGYRQYYGWTTDGNHLYLMDDFTVTHNCGKTIVFSKVAEERIAAGKVLIMAHREELLSQAADKIWKSCRIPCSLEKAESSSLGRPEMITVGSVQTLMSEKRLAMFAPDHFKTVIVDEAHHALSDSYQRVLNHFSGAKVLGVTATPDRGDKKNLGQYFDNLAYEYSLLDAIREEYLCPIRAKTIPLQIDLNNVKISQGDYQVGDLGDALEPYLEQIADAMMDYMDRKTVVFLPLVATSQKFCRMLQERGFRACEVNGNSPDRAEILNDFENDRYNVICNSMLLTEGWDCPSVDCIVILRPTKVRSLYCQMVGRGTRLHPGKDHLLLLDFLWMCERHELCRPAYLISKNEKEAKAITDKILDNEGEMDLLEAEAQVEADAAAEREAALARELEKQRRKKSKLIDPLAAEFLLDIDWEPTFSWELEAPTKKQLDTLENFGIDASQIYCKGEASVFLDRCFKRMTMGLATPKQALKLNQYGFRHPELWKKDDAAKVMGILASNRWRLPDYIDPETYCPDYIRRVS